MTNMLKKVFNWLEVHLSEVTFYKIHTLAALLQQIKGKPKNLMTPYVTLQGNLKAFENKEPQRHHL